MRRAALAQRSSPRDIQRLHDNVFDASADLSTAAAARRAARGESLERELDDLRDEVIYLKVKLRKDSVTRGRIFDLRDRIDRLRSETRGDAAPASSSAPRRPVSDERAQRDRNSRGHRVRRAAAIAAEFRHGAGRRSLRRDDHRALRAQRSPARAGGLGDARCRQLRDSREPRRQSERGAHAHLRSFLDRRSHLLDSSDGHAGAAG